MEIFKIKNNSYTNLFLENYFALTNERMFFLIKKAFLAFFRVKIA